MSVNGDSEPERKTSNDKDSKAEIKVGDEHQAQIPMYEGPYSQPNEAGDFMDTGLTSIFRQTTELETCIWRPPNIKIPEHKVQEFVEKCYLEHGWAEEQALGILYVRKFNFRRAMDTTKTFEPMPSVMESFTEDDKNAFFYAYKVHSRQFSKLKGTDDTRYDIKLSKIKGYLPHKKISELVNFYYIWKRKGGLKKKISRLNSGSRHYDLDADPETPELKEEESDEFLDSVFNDIPKEEKERIEKRAQHEIYQTYQSIQLFKQKVEAQKNETQKKLRSYNPNGELDLDQILKDSSK
ncbi:Oidioi.mRNA.OKI2018_I69.PAR.g9762.t1.cds [Oikopleura dioica]|uniref:Oidioi.mRNA.OKI2018_I69.PAR.g9762.t1.cds n=1 Tax=Oikopleura dioica TaxID=34765 RepID=A0ABN7RR86_OIKDI|nr:Oidioi.mRNA.OKI2018_I69.PAR.g9762.t1.cds [Oikopleura dioica]